MPNKALVFHVRLCWVCIKNERRFAVNTSILLAVCAVLVGFGTLVVITSNEIFMSLLGGATLACGGSAAYLILSHRRDKAKRDKPR